MLCIDNAGSNLAMPPKLPWVTVHSRLSGQDSERVIDELRSVKALRINGSNRVTCKLCTDRIPHVMRYQLFECVSKACDERTIPEQPCPWKGKVEKCEESNVAAVYSMGEHFAAESDGRTGKLTRKQKDLAGSLAGHGLKPKQILNRFLVDTVPADLPALQKLQRYVTYYRRTMMNNTDDLDVIEHQIKLASFTGLEEEDHAFSFSAETDRDDTPHVGDGSDEDPFVIGIATKTLVRQLDRDPATFIFHLDTTFKLNQAGYPVLVCGISDANRSFHLVAIFIMSQRQTEHCVTALASLSHIYSRVTSKPLLLRYVMGDADEAQVNAAKAVFRGCEFDYLMCFYHVMAKLLEHSTSVPNAKSSLVIADVYAIHCAKTAAELLSLKTAAVRRWRADPEVARFGEYIYKQWMSGSFTKWQCVHTPIGFATTNNPVEQFNKILKRDYTTHQQLKMGLLLIKLAECCQSVSVTGVEFTTSTVPRTKLKKRATELRRQGFLVEVPALEIAEKGDDIFMMVLQHAVPRVWVEKTTRPTKKGKKKQGESVEVLASGEQFRVNNARMEREGQPDAGWAVNLQDRSCPCNYFYKYGQCVHLLFALFIRFGNDSPPKRTLVNRSQRGRKRNLESLIADAVSRTHASRGRPILNGHALSLE
jgi:hypothetical protein